MNSFMSLVIFFKIIVNLNVIFLLQDKQMKGNRSGKYVKSWLALTNLWKESFSNDDQQDEL